MTPSMHRWCWKLGLASALAMGGALTASFDYALAQITPDVTLGAESSVVTPTTINDLPTNQIDGGATQGANLFHSFEQFSIPTGSAAFFNNAPDIQNIISRVTGSSISNIDGLLQANGTANLFLINPNGIIFGPNATLAINGSFLGSTASGLNFADGTQFSATAHSTTPLLTISVPIGLQFGGAAVGISVNGSGLTVQPGKTLGLVGGDVKLEGGNLAASGGTNLQALEGRIEIGSVAENSFVNLTSTDQGWNLGYGGVQNFKDIQLSQGAFVDAGAGGSAQVQGRRVTIQDGAAIAINIQGSKPGGTLAVRASDSVELSGTTVYGSGGLFAGTAHGATGNGGNLTIETGRLLIRDGAVATTSTFGAGRAGNLIVRALNSVELVGVGTTPDGQSISGLFAQVNSGGTDNAGDVTIETGRLTILGGAQISTAARTRGQAGTLTINALDFIQLSGTSLTATENSGSSGLFVSAEPGSGATSNSGRLTITTKQLTVQDAARISADNFGPAQGGNATLNVQQLIIRNGGQVRAGSFDEGPGGTLNVNASDSVEVSGTGKFGPSTLFTQAKGSGDAGELNIRTGKLIVRDGGEVTVSSTGSGQAGKLQLTARELLLDNRGAITATTILGNGGDITLQAQDLLLLRRNSQISSTAGTEQTGGNGGNITIETDNLVALEDSNITANAFEGRGGNIQITTEGLFLSPESNITASSERGIDGVVEVNRSDVDPSQGLAPLPAELVDASGLIAQSCPAIGENEFIITGRGGLPPNPSETLSSDTVWTDLRTFTKLAENRPSSELANQPTTNPTPEQLVEAQGWVINNKGEVVLIAQAPNVTPNIPWMNPATCHTPEPSF